MPSSNRPTDAELSILRVLWDEGPSTVRQVQERLETVRSIGYTTVLKLLQIMHEKGIVDRDESSRSHVYAAVRGEEETQRRLLGDLMERAFEGSASKLVLRALEAGEVSDSEMAQVRRILRRHGEGEDS